MSLSNINNGLVFAASPTLPEYPDNVAGATYISNWASGVDGWTSSGPGVSVINVSNELVIAGDGTNDERRARRVLSGGAGLTFRIRIKSSSPTATVRIATSLSGVVTNLQAVSVLPLSYTTFDFTTTTAFDEIRIHPSRNSTANNLTLSFLYIGDGTYSSRLLDASGNGNHGTVFGATPTADGGLSGDGVNDYVSFGDAAKITGALSISCWVKANAALSGLLGIIGKYRTGTSQRQYLIDTNNGTPRFLIANVGTAVSITLQAPTLAISQSVFEHLAAIYIPSTGVYLYRNGVLVASNTTSIPSQLFNGTAPLEMFRDSGGTLYTNITIRATRIYNRALTEAEITALAANPDAYNLDRVVRSITPVPGSVMTRDINGDTQVRRLESTIATGTAPLTVASTTLVTNLNADRVDSLEGSDFVRGTGTVAQTITGVKTFSAIPILPASDPTTVNQATRKAYIDGKVPGKITISASTPTGGTDGDIWITI
jgi:hypothetical protein